MGDIDHHEIGFGARRDPPEIVAAERAGAADRGRREDIGRRHCMRLAGGHSRQYRGGAQLLDEVVRECVGTDPQIDPGGTIAAEILEQDAAARKHRRAMRHGSAGLSEMGEVVAGRPVQLGMMVEKNRVADDRFGAEHLGGEDGTRHLAGTRDCHVFRSNP